MEFIETSIIELKNVPWDIVRTALGGSRNPGSRYQHIPGFVNMPSDVEDQWVGLTRQALEAAQMDTGLVEDAVLQSTQPMPYGWRELEQVEGSTVPHIKDPMGGQWNILLPCNLQIAGWCSATSGSTIRVERNLDGSWDITGEFPMENGKRYEGLYFANLMEAARFAHLQVDNQEKISAVMAEYTQRWNGIVTALHAECGDALEDIFQEWYPDDDNSLPVAGKSDLDTLTKLAIGKCLSITIHFPSGFENTNSVRGDVPVYAASLRPLAGWADDLIAELNTLGAPTPPEPFLAVLPLAVPPAEEMPVAY